MESRPFPLNACAISTVKKEYDWERENWDTDRTQSLRDRERDTSQQISTVCGSRMVKKT
jgi:hypothetical protein